MLRSTVMDSYEVFLIPRTGQDLPLSFAARLVEGYRVAEGFDKKFVELTGRGVGEEEAQKEAGEYAQQYSELKKGHDDSVLSGDRKLLRNDRFLQLDFRGRTPAFRRISAADLLFDESAQMPADLFRNQMVLIGASYVGSGDLYPTPFYELDWNGRRSIR